MADYYCDFDAASDGTGTKASPWNVHTSIDLTAISADTDTVRRIFLSGTQSTQWALTSAQLTGVLGRVIEIRGDGGLGVYDGVGDGNDKGVISIIANDFLKLSGLTFHGNNQAAGVGEGLHIDDCDNVTIEKCTAYDNYIQGIVVSDSTNCVIEKCTVHSNYVKGIAVVGILGAAGANTNNVKIRYNTGYNNGRYAFQVGGDPDNHAIDVACEIYGNVSNNDGNGIQVEHANNVKIYGNTVTNAGSNTIVDPGGTNPGNGIILQGEAKNIDVFDNTIRDGDFMSIDFRVDTQSPTLIHIYSNKMFEPARGQVNADIAGANNIRVNGNLMWYSATGTANQTGLATNVSTGTNQFNGNTVIRGNLGMASTVGSGWEAKNNIFYSPFRGVSATGAGVVTLLNNCYFQGGGETLVRNNSLTHTSATLTGAGAGQDATPVFTDPLITDEANEDFSIASTSDCRSSGIRWWSGVNPESINTLFTDWDTDIGGFQTKGPFHPDNL